MRTTELIVEILTAGLLTLLSLALIAFGCAWISQQEVNRILVFINENRIISLPLILSFSYLFGSTSSWISYELTQLIAGNRIRGEVFGTEVSSYKKIRESIYQNASDNAISKMKEKLAAVRLSRSSILIFPFLGLGFYLNDYFFLCGVCVISLLISLVQYLVIFNDYNQRLLNTFEELERSTNP